MKTTLLKNFSEDQYDLPKKNLLVLSCIDLRLTDNLVDFLHSDNLHNRYDHFILAGASLTLSAPDTPEGQCDCKQCKKRLHINSYNSEMYPFDGDKLGDYSNFMHWKRNLLEHIEIAVALHQIHDIYIIEHENCGAYTEFLKDVKFNNSDAEKKCHSHFAYNLADEISKVEYKYPDLKFPDGKLEKLHVHCFYIDLRGNVELLKRYDI